MKKALNWISVIALWVSAVLLGVAVIVPALSEEAIDAAFSLVVLASYLVVICGAVGVLLIFSKNDTAKKIGHGLYIATLIISLASALNFINVEPTAVTAATTTAEVETVSAIGAILILIGAILGAVHYLLQLVILILNNGAKDSGPYSDSRIVRIKEWKQLLDEGIITKEEYEEKRVTILGLKKAKDNAPAKEPAAHKDEPAA